MLRKLVKNARFGEVLVERVRAIAAASIQRLRRLDHDAEERARKCLGHGSLVNGEGVGGRTEIAMAENRPDAIVRVLVQLLADGSARLPGLSCERP